MVASVSFKVTHYHYKKNQFERSESRNEQRLGLREKPQTEFDGEV